MILMINVGFTQKGIISRRQSDAGFQDEHVVQDMLFNKQHITISYQIVWFLIWL